MKDKILQGGVAKIPLGRYVLAVSGGVDSIVLLDLLAKQAKSPKLRVPSSDKKAPSSQLPVRSYKFVVAHFNHGIRLDSGEDEKLVADAAGKYGLRFKVGQGRLGPGTSEDQARAARYKFLETVRKSCQAKIIITAHHQDDVMETAILNLLRGSGRRGLTAIIQNPRIIRPLAGISKRQIINYAQKNNLAWREDPTNIDSRYLRNYIRRYIMPSMKASDRQRFLAIIERMAQLNRDIDSQLKQLSKFVRQGDNINRHNFIMLPTSIGRELLAYWLRAQPGARLDKKTIGRLLIMIKTAQPGTKHTAGPSWELIIDKVKAKFVKV